MAGAINGQRRQKVKIERFGANLNGTGSEADLRRPLGKEDSEELPEAN